MLHSISVLLMGVIFWALALNVYPFNQKGFEVLDPLKKNYRILLKVSGTIFILYSILLIIEI